MLSVPDGDALEAAFGELDLMVSLDFYVNETNRHADYVLPTTTMYERDDVPVALMSFFSTPFLQVTEAVTEPPGEARQEWEIIDAITRRIGRAPYSAPALRALAKVGLRLSPQRLVDLLLRTGPRGDWFGLRRSGISVAKLLRDHPHGLVLSDHVKTGRAARPSCARAPSGSTWRRRRSSAEMERLGREAGPELGEFPLRLIGLRELRSHNSWMHNAPLLMRGERVHALRVHPDDAAAHGLEDGGKATLESKSAAVEVPVAVTDEMTPGAVALPHGWGHGGGWQLANANAGVNVNLLASGAPEDLEALAGMAHLNGIPVRCLAGQRPRRRSGRRGSGAVTVTVVPLSELSIDSSPSSISVRSRMRRQPDVAGLGRAPAGRPRGIRGRRRSPAGAASCSPCPGSRSPARAVPWRAAFATASWVMRNSSPSTSEGRSRSLGVERRPTRS